MFNKRICNKCEEKKPLTDFTKDSKGPSGYAVRCKRCKNESRKVRKNYKEFISTKAKVILESLEASKVSKQENHRPKKENAPEVPSNTITIKPSGTLSEIYRKFGKHTLISIGKDQTVITVQDRPSKTWKGTDPDLLLEEVRAYCA